MKIHLTYIGLFSCLTIFSQNSEFKTYPNGLIYSEKTMSQLSHIVDSLNLKFKSCDLRSFYAKSQTVGSVVRLTSGDIKNAKKDIENNMSLDEFIKHYPAAEIEKEALIIRWKYKNYDEEDVVEFEQVDLKDGGSNRIQSNDIKIYNTDLQNKWVFEYNKKTDYSGESITAFFFPNKFESKKLSDKYAQMVGYSDCLIDTTTTKFKEKTKDGWVELPNNWTSLSDKKKNELLESMRSTHVMGYCSQDSRPRTHAIHIALVSAETRKWEVFLKAHLDIMNDRFDRMSDGSYAWGQRQTYIKELEELNINVPDLIFGITFRIENESKNHYYGSTGRIGRALSESKNRTEIEKAMLTMIADPDLDDYNRAVIYFLYLNYNYNIKDEKLMAENKDKLKLSVLQLPNYLKNGVSFK